MCVLRMCFVLKGSCECLACQSVFAAFDNRFWSSSLTFLRVRVCVLLSCSSWGSKSSRRRQQSRKTSNCASARSRSPLTKFCEDGNGTVPLAPHCRIHHTLSTLHCHKHLPHYIITSNTQTPPSARTRCRLLSICKDAKPSSPLSSAFLSRGGAGTVLYQLWRIGLC